MLFAGLCLVITAATEPAIPGLLKQLMDRGFQAGELPLWTIPTAIIGLFIVRGFSAWLGNYGLTLGAQNAVLALRNAVFADLMRAAPALFSKNTASGLTNALVYEIQQGANLLMGSVNILVRDSLTAVALTAYLIYLDWKLTLFILVLFPVVGILVRIVSKRLRRLTVAGQDATDELAYVVEENVLAWRIVRLHGAESQETGRFDGRARLLRGLTIKQAASGSLMTPVTQVLAAVALSAVILMALRQSSHDQTTVGDFVAFVTCMLMLIQPFKHLSDVMAPLTRGTAAMERGIELIEQAPRESGGTLAPARVRGDIELHDVSLRYAKGESANGGEPGCRRSRTCRSRSAPARRSPSSGPSGAGKTSLVNLPAPLRRADERLDRLDGALLADYDIAALRSQFAS
jgi:subfamily B ATP-binding cassette protein MsbA